MNPVILAILIIAFFGMIYYLFKEIQEYRFLKFVLKNIIEKSKIGNKEDLIKIKRFLSSNIQYKDELKNKKRPLLRETASKILQTHYGFCGENARVGIKLFLIGGIKARRIYLFRKEWQHVLIEHQLNNRWFMFDGHYDPQTALIDENVATIPSEEISSYPDEYPNNPYLNFCRIKLFYKITPLKFLSKVKLPSAIIYLFESPYLIKSITLLMVVCLVLFIRSIL